MKLTPEQQEAAELERQVAELAAARGVSVEQLHREMDAAEAAETQVAHGENDLAMLEEAEMLERIIAEQAAARGVSVEQLYREMEGEEGVRAGPEPQPQDSRASRTQPTIMVYMPVTAAWASSALPVGLASQLHSICVWPPPRSVSWTVARY